MCEGQFPSLWDRFPSDMYPILGGTVGKNEPSYVLEATAMAWMALVCLCVEELNHMKKHKEVHIETRHSTADGADTPD